MRRSLVGLLLLMVSLGGCDNDPVAVVGDPAAPRALEASYYAGAVTVSWELAPDWDGEAFRVFSRRVTDSDYFFIAEVTSCAGGFCTYTDVNVSADQTYEYYVASVDPGSGVETPSDVTVEVFVPAFTPPPVPNGPVVIALDNANFITWGGAAGGADDFSHYRVYLLGSDDTEFLLGDTDSQGFLDLRALNGDTYDYFVTSVDLDGHESEGSNVATGTPRPDYNGELIYDYTLSAVPEQSGFRFTADEESSPIVHGDLQDRHFRLETDAGGFWLVPGAGTSILDAGRTSALKCGPAADFDCIDVSVAPSSGYSTLDTQLFAESTYVLRVIGDDGQVHYGAVRVEFLGADQNGDLMIFDWAYQLQPGNPSLSVIPGGS